MKAIYSEVPLSYTKLISKYKKGINIKNNATIFPIGLLSPILLRELYLYAFDQRTKFALNPTHYGRYVDDMIIIIPAEVQANNVTQNYVCNLLKEKGLIRKEKPGIYANTNHPVKQKSLPNFLERLFYGQ